MKQFNFQLLCPKICLLSCNSKNCKSSYQFDLLLTNDKMPNLARTESESPQVRHERGLEVFAAANPEDEVENRYIAYAPKQWANGSGQLAKSSLDRYRELARSSF